MGETMDFLKTPLEFIEQYRIIDNEEVYTNGAVLVPMLRVRQMIEQYFPRWIPVTPETMPKAEEKVIVMCRTLYLLRRGDCRGASGVSGV